MRTRSVLIVCGLLLALLIGCQAERHLVLVRPDGGVDASAGGASAATGSAVPGTGGATASTGGTPAGTGGATQGTGGEGVPGGGTTTGAAGGASQSSAGGLGIGAGTAGAIGTWGAGGAAASSGGGASSLSFVEVTQPSDAVARSVAVGDIDGDGLPDIAIGKDRGVAIFRGNAGFMTPAGLEYVPGAPGNASSVALADLNGDGKADLVVAGDAALNIIINRGDGTFLAPTHLSYPAGTNVTQIVAGDLNGDGKADLAVASQARVNGQAAAPGVLGVLINRGAGTFAAQVNYAAGWEVASVALGDLNGDGKTDLAVANKGTAGPLSPPVGAGVMVFMNMGTGTFAAPTTYASRNSPTSVAIGDLTGDGKPEIAFSNALTADLSVLLNKGDGTFGAPNNYPTAGVAPASAIALGDFDGDGTADLVLLDERGLKFGCYNTGDGTFNDPEKMFEAGAPSQTAMAIADIDMNGVSDMVTVGPGSVGLLIQLSISGVGMGIPTLPANVTATALADVNGDGRLDLITATRGVTVAMGNGDGTFESREVTYPVSWPDSLEVGDLNGDGKVDLVTTYSAMPGGPRVSVLLNKGDGTFFSPVEYAVGSCFAMKLADLNGDGKPDIVVLRAEDAQVLLNSGTGTFAPPQVTPVWNTLRSRSLAIGDLNGDGRPDLVVGNWRTSVLFLLNTGSGAFAEPVPLATDKLYSKVAIIDLNADGRPEIVVGGFISPAGGAYTVFPNVGGAFGPPVGYSVTNYGPEFGDITVVDVDGDGKLDLVPLGTHDVFLNQGDGTLGPEISLAGASAVGDVNGDGRVDMVVLSGPYGNQLAQVWLNTPR